MKPDCGSLNIMPGIAKRLQVHYGDTGMPAHEIAIDQLPRTPEGLAHSLAKSLLSVAHYKIAFAPDALLVISPEHTRTFKEAGWSKQ